MPLTSILGLSRLAKPLTSKEGNMILQRDRYRCQYCGLDGAASFENSLILTVDFVHPRAKKGKKDPANLVTSCRPCNVIKGHHVFATVDDARKYVLERRAALHKDWELRLARLHLPETVAK